MPRISSTNKWRCTSSTQNGTVFDVELVEERPGIAVLQVTGKTASQAFANESGGHRWQRVPPNEKKGRVHTSTVTVCCLDVPEERDMPLDDRDLRWTFCRSGGKGGQHVNRTDSAVQLMHVPTGVMVRCESERSQTQNKITARMLLQARLAETKRSGDAKDRSALRKALVGVGARGDKVISIALQRDQVVHHVTGKRMSATRYLQGHVDEIH
jgi:peptide chain release factor 1